MTIRDRLRRYLGLDFEELERAGMKLRIEECERRANAQNGDIGGLIGAIGILKSDIARLQIHDAALAQHVAPVMPKQHHRWSKRLTERVERMIEAHMREQANGKDQPEPDQEDVGAS